MDEYEELLRKYKDRIKKEFGEVDKDASTNPKVTSKEYTDFKRELYPTHFSFYEKACNFSEKFLKIKPDAKSAAKIQKSIKTVHMNITPTGVVSFSLLAAILFIVLGALAGYALPLLLVGEPILFFVGFFVIGGVILIPLLQKLPDFMATTWRMKASNQMVQSIFYMVTYMRHTSNLERAIEFAANHLEAPLSLDFRKILWDVETQRYSSIKDAANAYLEDWKEFDKEFVESFHLVESSLYEGAEERRLALLDKALDVILTGTYENMLHYAHNLKSPMTMLHMLGIILPILGLVILPLVVSFMAGGSNPFVTTLYIAAIYNISIPIAVYYLGRLILSKRPAGYGATDISAQPGRKKLRYVNIPIAKNFTISINPLYLSILVFVVLFVIGISPVVLHSVGAEDFALDSQGNVKMLDYVCPPEQGLICDDEEKIGPYGMGASILSLLIIAGLGLSIGLYFMLRSKNVIKIRKRTKELEEEFSSALFQLGNRLGDGIPAEIAFGKVSQTMKGTTSGDFFNLTERNITKLGMGLEQAIFDPKVGAIMSFPSKVIGSSMKVLIESIKKGPRIAAQALLSMAQYIKEIHRVEERLKDLMADVIASMKSQIKFLTPAISGIVIGITSMIATILTKLSAQLATFSASGADGVGYGGMLEIFGIGIPTYHFQIVVGIYIVQIIYILTILSNGIENGADKLGERYELGKNLTKSTLMYIFIAGLVMILFNVFANSIITNTIV